MMTGEHQQSLLQMISAVLRRPFAGPLLFGLVFGGIPSALVVVLLIDQVIAVFELYISLYTPIAVVVATIGAVWSSYRGWRNMLLRTFIISLLSYFLTPEIVWNVVLWRRGWDIFDIHNYFPSLCFFSAWATLITVTSWLLALVYVRIQNWRTQAGRRRPS